ncbi:MAG: phosphodiester glycosidase family protein [Gemmatimonadetes bacterium]|nr:phosphodiester glycosidase family protein [Gemmatimonadota bacterium]
MAERRSGAGAGLRSRFRETDQRRAGIVGTVVRCGTVGGAGSSRIGAVRAALVVAPLLLSLSGCEPPDRPPAFTAGLPPAAVSYLAPDRISTFRLEEGVTYRSVRSGARPWSLHLLEVDATRCELGFRVVRAEDREGRTPVSELAHRSEPGVIAAVNGDFFTPENLPLGPEISGGTVRGRSSRSVFAWRPGQLPTVGPAVWSEGTIAIGSWTVSVDAPDRDIQVVAGFPALLESGVAVGDLQQSARPDFAAERDPRSAVGFDRETRRVWLVVVEGRREGVSEGMTLPELAGLFQALGVDDAINLDGGGSSVMVIRREPVSRPSDPTGERPVVNALVLREDPLYCS